MRKISILTPVLANKGTLRLLPRTIESVAAQLTPNNWQYEWIVVEDGTRPFLAKYKWPDSVKYRSVYKQVGEPCARTLALSMASGDYVLAFDADDTLPADTLNIICQTINNNANVHWVAGQESTPRHPRPWINRNDKKDYLPEGYCKPGIIYPFYKRTGQFPVTFQCTYRTETLWRFGGYPAMPYAGDINLLFAISSLYSGVLLHDVLLNYRRWPGQMTAQKEYFAVEDLSEMHANKWVDTLTKSCLDEY